MKKLNKFTLMIGLMCLPFTIHAAVLDTMLSELKAEAGASFSADKGKSMWTKEYKSKKNGSMRSCASCHTKNLKNTGKHKKTGKKIDPLAKSSNSERLTDRKKINKWFKRNCKWTLGRECNAQEKGDFLMYISSQ